MGLIEKNLNDILKEDVEERTNIANLGGYPTVIDNPDKLVQLWSVHKPANGVFCTLGYFCAADVAAKYDDGSGQKVPNPAYYSGPRGSGSSGVVMLKLIQTSIQWGVNQYSQKSQDRNNAIVKQLEAHPEWLQNFKEKFPEKVYKYSQWYPEQYEKIDWDFLDVPTAAGIIGAINPNEHRGSGWVYDKETGIATHEKTGSRALRITMSPKAVKPRPSRWFMTTPQGDSIREIGADEAYKYLKPKKEELKQLTAEEQEMYVAIKSVDDLYEFRDYVVEQVAYISFSYKDENGQKVEFTYVNPDMDTIGSSGIKINKGLLKDIILDIAKDKLDDIQVESALKTPEDKLNETIDLMNRVNKL